MGFEHKDGSFSAFKNDKKEKATHADYTGSGMINGEEVWINIWVKEKGGKKYFSGSVRPKQPKAKNQTKEAAPQKTPRVPQDFSDEIPFDRIRGTY
jgi:hypothetical protein